MTTPELVLKKECVEYLKSQPVFRKILSGFRNKYESLGAFGGRVKVEKLSLSDMECLEGFFAKNFHGQKSVTISAKSFQKALAGSRYHMFSAQEILEAYFDNDLISKKEQTARKNKEWEEFFTVFLDLFDGTIAKDWLSDTMDSKNNAYDWLQKKYHNSSGQLGKSLNDGMRAINALPVFSEECSYLGIFSAKITGNPHDMDEGTDIFSILMYFAQYFSGLYKLSEKLSRRPVRKQQSLYSLGLIKDDISNYMITYGLHGRCKNGEIHQGMEGFCERNEALHLPLSTISDLQEIWCNSPYLYGVENPLVFLHLTRCFPHHAFLCLNGQPNLANYVLMDKIIENNIKIYYSGDFDPEGLNICDRLKQEYGDMLVLWNMDKESYLKSMSETVLNEKRLKQLERIKDESLREVAECMKAKKKAGYQERILEEYVLIEK